MSISINKNIDDYYYCYKFPKLVTKIEGAGDSIETVIVNMSEIAKALYRKPSYSTKYFGIELGVQVILDERQNRYTVIGCHEAKKLQDLLNFYIKKFVLCERCLNSETSLFTKKSKLFYICKSCGFSDQIDPIHGLTQYILKDLPFTEAEGAHIAITKNETVQYKINYSWEDELSDSNTEILLQHLKTNDVLRVTSESQKIMIFKNYVEELFNKRDIISQRKTISKKMEELSLDSAFILILMEIIFCNRETLLSDVELYKVLFQYFTRQGQQQKMQYYVLIGMEKVLLSLNIAGSACHFLKALYDNDIVEEETILKWYNNTLYPSLVTVKMSNIIRNECSKMVQWFLETDDESEG